MNIPKAPSIPTVQSLTEERRAVIKEAMNSTCKVTTEMLMFDVKRIDRQLAKLRAAT